MKVSEDVSLSTKVELGLDNDSIFWKTRKKTTTHGKRKRFSFLVTAFVVTFLVIEAFI